ncbi:MAG: hypothetical protein HYZ53_05010 [Planctomycetes bacterium]|nr:hypothetical protein [Planctomycetota bacterium]
MDFTVREVLAGVRRSHREAESTAIGLVAAAAAMLWVTAWTAADRALVLPPALRFGALLGLALLLAAAAALYLRSRKRRLSDLHLAKAVEDAAPHLKNGLMTLLELEEKEPRSAVTGALRRRVRQGLAGLDLNTVAPPARLAWAGSLALTGFVILAGALLVGLGGFLTCLGRTLLPWAAFLHPSETRLAQVLPGRTTVVSGTALAVRCRLVGREPGEVWLFHSVDGRQWLRQRLHSAGEGAWAGTCAGVREGFRYFVVAGDARSEEFPIEVIPAPGIVAVKVKCQFPLYADMPPAVVEGGTVDAPIGSLATLVATVTPPTRSVRLVRARPSAHGQGDPGESGTPAAAVVSEGAVSFSFRVERNDVYTLLAFSKEDGGLCDPAPPTFDVRARPDRAPEVAITRPGRDSELAANLHQTLSVVAQDDLGLSDVTLFVKRRGDARFSRRPLAPRGDARVMAQEVDLVPSREGWAPGDAVLYYVEARDRKAPAAGVARSELYTLEIQPPDVARQADEERYQEEQEVEDKLDAIVRKDEGADAEDGDAKGAGEDGADGSKQDATGEPPKQDGEADAAGGKEEVASTSGSRGRPDRPEDAEKAGQSGDSGSGKTGAKTGESADGSGKAGGGGKGGGGAPGATGKSQAGEAGRGRSGGGESEAGKAGEGAGTAGGPGEKAGGRGEGKSPENSSGPAGANAAGSKPGDAKPTDAQGGGTKPATDGVKPADGQSGGAGGAADDADGKPRAGSADPKGKPGGGGSGGGEKSDAASAQAGGDAAAREKKTGDEGAQAGKQPEDGAGAKPAGGTGAGSSGGRKGGEKGDGAKSVDGKKPDEPGAAGAGAGGGKPPGGEKPGAKPGAEDPQEGTPDRKKEREPGKNADPNAGSQLGDADDGKEKKGSNTGQGIAGGSGGQKTDRKLGQGGGGGAGGGADPKQEPKADGEKKKQPGQAGGGGASGGNGANTDGAKVTAGQGGGQGGAKAPEGGKLPAGEPSKPAGAPGEKKKANSPGGGAGDSGGAGGAGPDKSAVDPPADASGSGGGKSQAGPDPAGGGGQGGQTPKGGEAQGNQSQGGGSDAGDGAAGSKAPDARGDAKGKGDGRGQGGNGQSSGMAGGGGAGEAAGAERGAGAQDRSGGAPSVPDAKKDAGTDPEAAAGDPSKGADGGPRPPRQQAPGREKADASVPGQDGADPSVPKDAAGQEAGADGSGAKEPATSPDGQGGKATGSGSGGGSGNDASGRPSGNAGAGEGRSVRGTAGARPKRGAGGGGNRQAALVHKAEELLKGVESGELRPEDLKDMGLPVEKLKEFVSRSKRRLQEEMGGGEEAEAGLPAGPAAPLAGAAPESHGAVEVAKGEGADGRKAEAQKGQMEGGRGPVPPEHRELVDEYFKGLAKELEGNR